MNRATLRACITTLVLLAAAWGLLALTGNVRVDAALPLAEALPARVGNLQGVGMLFCQSDQCGRAFRVDTLTNTNACPNCGSAMDGMALAEHRYLPADTTVTRMAYADEFGPAFTVAVVVSGTSRRSIHPPQVCLVAQGYTIRSERVRPVTLADGKPRGVKILDLTASAALGAGTAQYAYWFAARGHETPYHMQRILWTAWDGIAHGVHRRWAYVAVTSERPGSETARGAAMDRFIAELYPLIQPDGR